MRTGILLVQGRPIEVFENKDIVARSVLKILRLELLNHFRNHPDSLKESINSQDMMN
jgi:hypothetical protein